MDELRKEILDVINDKIEIVRQVEKHGNRRG